MSEIPEWDFKQYATYQSTRLHIYRYEERSFIAEIKFLSCGKFDLYKREGKKPFYAIYYKMQKCISSLYKRMIKNYFKYIKCVHYLLEFTIQD